MSQDSVTAAVVERMRAERRRRRWSAEDLEDAMRRTGTFFPRSIIANLENRRRDHIQIDELVGLAKVFGTTVNWLVWGTGTACTHCGDRPPEGFTCNECGRSTSVRVADVVDQSAFFDQYVGGGS